MFFAYALVVARIPSIAGMIFGTILTFPVSIIVRFTRRGQETQQEAKAAIIREPVEWLTRGKLKMSFGDIVAHACHDIFCGVGSVLAAAILFHYLHTPLTFWVPLIIVFWEIVFMVYCKQSFRALFCSVIGLIVGWIIILALS